MIKFTKLHKKGWAISPRGNRREWNNYAIVKDGEKIGDIRGYLAYGGSIYYNVETATGRKTCFSLREAKQSLTVAHD